MSILPSAPPGLDYGDNKPHPHAEIIGTYAELAKLTVTPWIYIETQPPHATRWTVAQDHPTWAPDYKYRVRLPEFESTQVHQQGGLPPREGPGVSIRISSSVGATVLDIKVGNRVFEKPLVDAIGDAIARVLRNEA